MQAEACGPQCTLKRAVHTPHLFAFRFPVQYVSNLILRSTHHKDVSGGNMKFGTLALIVLAILAVVCTTAHAQVSMKTGSIYGKVVDDQGAPLPGVNITIESDVIPAQIAQSGPSGGFRFANLPPGV